MEAAPTILVVEDEYFIAVAIEDALTDAGFEVVAVGSADEAILLLKDALAFRALITDINGLGDIDGWEIAKRAREIDASLPVIYMTGAAAVDWSARGVPKSVLIPKPFAPAQIVTAVSQLLNGAGPSAGGP
ncbi:response regulator [Bradyrhizobium sp. 76]|uniref:response regulator n=1 Tax=Bradyrhizobium sp. 76 TaxID=2782680 RepID=UPI001FF7FD69